MQGWPIRRQLLSSFVYSQDCYIKASECRYLLSTTGQAIKGYCDSAGVTHASEELDCGPDLPPATLHYLNARPEDTGNVLLYFHGGGYGNPIIGLGHPPFVLDTARNASISKIVLLEYTLAPGLQYPGQMIQALTALRRLLNVHKASEIVIGGDSAGGNLTIAVISHIIKPSPYAPALSLGESNAEQLRGALLISPWVTFDDSAPSYRTQAGTDILNQTILREFTDHFKPKRGEIYAEPLVAEPEFWRNLPVKNILVTAGTWEIFVDDIQALAKKMGAEQAGGGASVELELSAKEQHIQCIVDYIVGLKPGFMATSVFDWSRRI